MSEDFDEILKKAALIACNHVKSEGINDHGYKNVMSDVLAEHEIIHEKHKKMFDKRKGKYRFIDLYFPQLRKFAKIKARRSITRTDMNDLKDEEEITGLKGIVINFHNGVTMRYSGDTKPFVNGSADIYTISTFPDLNGPFKPRKHLPHLSGSTGKLNDMNDAILRPPFYRYHRFPATPPSLSESRESFSNGNKIFALSCAAFFFSEGNRKQFSSIFNDLLETTKLDKIEIPDKYLLGPKLASPDGEVGDILRKALIDMNISRKRSANDANSSANEGENASED